jgi:hypothetical protein
MPAGAALYHPTVTLAFDGDPDVKARLCSHCNREYTLITCFVLKRGEAHCIARTALHDHEGREAWMDVIFGTFGEAAVQDRTTFGCRVGPVLGSAEPAATAVDAAAPYDDGPVWGHKLTRAEALAHPRLPEFWEVVDFLLTTERTIEHHVYHH